MLLIQYYKRIFYTIQAKIGMAAGATLMVILPVYPAAAALVVLPTEEWGSAAGMDPTGVTLFSILFLVLYFLLSVVLHNRMFQQKILDPVALKQFTPNTFDLAGALCWVVFCIGLLGWALLGR